MGAARAASPFIPVLASCPARALAAAERVRPVARADQPLVPSALRARTRTVYPVWEDSPVSRVPVAEPPTVSEDQML